MTVANSSLIRVFGQAGNDTLTEDADDDVLIGGGGIDTLDGRLGNNVVIQDAIGPGGTPTARFASHAASGAMLVRSPTLAPASGPNSGNAATAIDPRDTVTATDQGATGTSDDAGRTVTATDSGTSSTASADLRTANAALLVQFMASTFVTDGGGHGETPLVDPATTQQPLLAPSHV